MNEIWKDIEGYEGLYQVSDLSRVRSLITDKVLKQNKDTKGYFAISLCLDGKVTKVRVHRLVCLAFLPNPEGKSDVNHINGIKDDNRLANLEWATRSENVQHAYDTELRVGISYFGINNPNFGKPAYNRKKIKGINIQTLQEVIFESQKAAAAFIDGHPQNIYAVCSGRYKQTKGWTFSYLDEAA